MVMLDYSYFLGDIGRDDTHLRHELGLPVQLRSL